MATKKVPALVSPEEPPKLERTPANVLRAAVRALDDDTEKLRELNSLLVAYVNDKVRRERASVAIQFSPGDMVAFPAKKYGGRLIELRVDKVTPAGIVYGTSGTGSKWKVSATLCRKA